MVSSKDRADFRHFMCQDGWVKDRPRFTEHAYTYQLSTEWLRPYGSVFYVGVTQNLDRRLEQHVGEGSKPRWKPGNCGEIMHAFVDNSLLPEDFGKGLYEVLKNGIVWASVSSGQGFQMNKEAFIKNCIPSRMNFTYMRRRTKVFTRDVLEAERRHIFYFLQQRYVLANIEILFMDTVIALQQTNIDVLHLPINSREWDSIIEAYLIDREAHKGFGFTVY